MCKEGKLLYLALNSLPTLITKGGYKESSDSCSAGATLWVAGCSNCRGKCNGIPARVRVSQCVIIVRHMAVGGWGCSCNM